MMSLLFALSAFADPIKGDATPIDGDLIGAVVFDTHQVYRPVALPPLERSFLPHVTASVEATPFVDLAPKAAE